MKKFTAFIAILLLCVTALFAQSPEKFSYQAVVRNANNALVTNTPVGMRVSILQGSATGTPVYVETHTSTTNANGLLTVEIGGGNAQQGAFAAINWESGPYFLKTETDPNGGTNYSVTSTQQLLSVPYALYAKEAANSFSGDYNDLTNTPTIPTVPTNVSAFTNDAGYLTGYTETDPQYNAWDKDYNDLINKPQIPTVPTNVSAFNNDVPYLTSEQQILSISNDTIFLTGGSFVKLPAAAVGFSGDYNDLTNKPTIPTVPSNVSAFTNDAGYITGYTETDPQFNAWDKDYNDLINTPEIPTVPTNVSAFVNDVPYLTSYTEQQVLTISNDTIFLTGGSFVKLPAAAVGFSGDYNDLTNKPTIPTVPSNVSAFTNDAGYITGYTETDPLFNAWDKDYNDLINTPEIPTVPTNVSAFTNDAGYITNADIPEIPTVPTNVSAFTNDANYITAEDIPEQVNADWEATEGAAYILNKPENVSTFTNDAGYLTNADLLAVINALNARIDSLQNQLDNGGGQGGGTPSHHDDFENAQLPTVVTLEPVSNISQTTAQVSIMVLSDGGGVISQAGVCYDTTATPTVANDHIGGAWTGSNNYSSSTSWAMYPLIPGKTYYARAYATNNKGTAYGDVVTFTTLIAEQTYGEPCPEAATVTDIDGNEYNTVQIGEQCWMRESLRTTHTPSGEEIPLQNGRSIIPSGGMSRVATAGYIYTSTAAMNGASSSTTVPSGVQGICPDGWHLPSNAEWQILHDYASNQTDWLCGNGYYGKALAAATEWSTSTYDCDFGNNMLENNKSGFTALTLGYLHCSGHVELSSTGLSIYNYTISGSVRCLRDFQTPPSVVLNSTVKLTSSSLKVTSEVTYEGTGQVTERGVCWGTEPNPTIEGDHTSNGAGAGVFESEISGLIFGTNYYIRSYATNNAGTSYSEQHTYYVGNDNVSCPNATKVTDVDNNVYNTVQIGQQCWMKENLRTTRYADGSDITFISGGSYSTSKAYRYYPNGDSSNVSIFGYLYNWKAVMGNSSSSDLNPSGVQGICPVGWHVPSDAEWTELTDYVSSQSEYVCGDSSGNIAKALSATFGWLTDETSCAVGNDTNANNATGFSACPAGYYYQNYTQRFNQYADFWSSTQTGYEGAWYRDLDYRYPNVSRYSSAQSVGFSVRCLRDGGGTASLIAPTVTTTPAIDITTTSVTLTGLVSSSEAALTASGFEWKATGDGSYVSVTLETLENGAIAYNLTDLNPQTSYTFRAFAKTADTTIYGEEMTFTTPVACQNVSTIMDVDNNVYHTVLIGSQCWMAENLRTTHYSDGTEIPSSSMDLTDVNSTGYFYNWSAVMNGSSYSSSNPSGVQGVCPAGWHVPSYEEWVQLVNYLINQNQYQCGDNSNYIAKALASTNSDWSVSNNTCAVGNNLSANNLTGLGIRPTDNNGTSTRFWTTSVYDVSDPQYFYTLYLGNDAVTLGIYYNHWMGNMESVRCLRDGGSDGISATPTVSTGNASHISSNSATITCFVSNPEEVEVTVGFEWKLSNGGEYTSVTVENAHNGNIGYPLSGLSPYTNYTYRAFMTVLDSTAYGEEVTFLTEGGISCPNAATVTDIDGNVYNTVQIGNQCWMKENLRVKHYADGTGLSQGDYYNSNDYPNYYYANLDSNEVSVATYGLLYNWKAVMGTSSSSNTNPSGVQGICPTGWHVPSHAEWGVLRNYVSSAEFICDGVDNNAVGKSVASRIGWISSSTACDIGCQPENNNATGFSAVPAGYNVNGSQNFGQAARFWTTTQNNDYEDEAYERSLYYNGPYFYYNSGVDKRIAMSVRCLRNEAGGGETSATLPTVTTATVSDITGTTATCGGEVTNNGGATVTARGVCWSTSQNPTLSDSYTTDGNGTGAYVSNITGLTTNTTYYVRAYATNSAGTAYGSEQSFTTNSTCNLLNENFDNGAIPTGWTTLDSDGDGHFWSHNSSSELSTSLGHDGSSGFMTSASYMNNIGALTPDNWLISPAVTITNIATLSFWVKPQDANYRSEHYGVYVTTSNDYTNSDNYTLLFDETITQSGWEQKTVSLQDYAGQTVHIAFRHFNCSDWFYLEIDDVTIQYNCSTNGQ